MDDKDRVVIVVLFLLTLYFYSNPVSGKEKKYGAFSEPSADEVKNLGLPSGISLGSMTSRVHSPSSLMAWYASV